MVGGGVRGYSAGVSLSVNLPGELGAALEAEAARRGQTPEQVAADLLSVGLLTPRAAESGAKRVLAFAAVGESTSGRAAADADAMLAEGFGRD
jgi:plasmid stability protein